MTLWMEVTQDEYELPVAVADSRRELAELRHTTIAAISCAIYQAKSRKKRSRYVKVKIED